MHCRRSFRGGRRPRSSCRGLATTCAAATCRLRPKVENARTETRRECHGASAGETRSSAERIARDERTPDLWRNAHRSVRDPGDRRCRERGSAVMFYPFILMDQLAGNGLPDPWSDDPEQPPLPWRGRITTSLAPGRAGSARTARPPRPPRSRHFFGTPRPSDFVAVEARRQLCRPGGMELSPLHPALCASSARRRAASTPSASARRCGR